jgi:hypothetical protein
MKNYRLYCPHPAQTQTGSYPNRGFGLKPLCWQHGGDVWSTDVHQFDELSPFESRAQDLEALFLGACAQHTAHSRLSAKRNLFPITSYAYPGHADHINKLCPSMAEKRVKGLVGGLVRLFFEQSLIGAILSETFRIVLRAVTLRCANAMCVVGEALSYAIELGSSSQVAITAAGQPRSGRITGSTDDEIPTRCAMRCEMCLRILCDVTLRDLQVMERSGLFASMCCAHQHCTPTVLAGMCVKPRRWRKAHKNSAPFRCSVGSVSSHSDAARQHGSGDPGEV